MAERGRVLVHDTPSGERYVTAMVEWRHRRGSEAHCLGRLYRSGDGKRVVAILSELRTNPGHDVGADTPGAAAALLATAGSVVEVPPDGVVWFTHYGTFSSYDQFAADEFVLVDLLWTGDHFEDSLDRHRRLSRAEAAELLDGVSIRPVPEVMEELQGVVWHTP